MNHSQCETGIVVSERGRVLHRLGSHTKGAIPGQDKFNAVFDDWPGVVFTLALWDDQHHFSNRKFSTLKSTPTPHLTI